MAANRDIPDLPAAGALAGTDKFELSRGGVSYYGLVSALTATLVAVTPTGGIAATSVQAALAELDTEKAPKASPTFTGTVTLAADPGSSLEAATKQYVDNVAAGLDPKPSVKCATTANITLSGEQALDGITTSTSRVLVKNQSTASQNGIYVSAAGAWARATDMDAWTEIPGAHVWVEEGSTLADTAWVCTANSGGTLGSTSITWGQFGGTGVFAPLASPAFTGTPTAPNAAADTNTTQIATTAYYCGQASAATPAALGTAAVGTSLKFARADHVHAIPAQPIITTYLSGSGTFTPNASTRRIKVRMVAAGGSGQGSGTSPGNGTKGDDTSFGSWTAIGGSGGNALTGGAGGTGGTDHTGTVLARIAGGRGADGRSGYTFAAGGLGGGTPFGSAVANAPSELSRTGSPNTGVGGSGGSADATGSMGAGGGGGEYVEFIITTIAGSYAYAVGAGKTGGTIGTGTNPRAGSASQAGRIVVEEYFV